MCQFAWTLCHLLLTKMDSGSLSLKQRTSILPEISHDSSPISEEKSPLCQQIVQLLTLYLNSAVVSIRCCRCDCHRCCLCGFLSPSSFLPVNILTEYYSAAKNSHISFILYLTSADFHKQQILSPTMCFLLQIHFNFAISCTIDVLFQPTII